MVPSKICIEYISVQMRLHQAVSAYRNTTGKVQRKHLLPLCPHKYSYDLDHKMHLRGSQSGDLVSEASLVETQS